MPAADPTDEALEAARALRSALTSLAAALEAGRLAGVLESEPALSLALASATRARTRLETERLDSTQSAALRAELRDTSAALARCAALGGALDELVRARCGVSAYVVSGRTIPMVVPSALAEQG